MRIGIIIAFAGWIGVMRVISAISDIVGMGVLVQRIRGKRLLMYQISNTNNFGRCLLLLRQWNSFWGNVLLTSIAHEPME